jgi:kinesin family protein C1
VFAEVAQLVQSALDGYRVCIFAYGSTGAPAERCGVPATCRAGTRAPALTAQTRHSAGSGKTHTMIGGAGEERGVVPRALEKLYARAGELQQHHGWAITLKVPWRSTLRLPCAGRLPALTMPGPAPGLPCVFQLRRARAQATCLEIFCDELVDLLGGGPPAGKKHTITHGAAGAEVAHLRAVPLDIAAPAQARALLAGAMERRAVAAMACNERSSRSHLVFTIAVAASNARTGQTTTGAHGPGSAPS